MTNFFCNYFSKKFKKVFGGIFGENLEDRILGSPLENMKFGYSRSSDKFCFFRIGRKIGSPMENPFCGYGCG